MAEATGLALAVFPLVVKGISVYVDGTRTIKDLWHWKLGLKCLVRELTMENVLFQNSCQNVLKGMCQDTDAVLLLRGEGWDDDFKAHLRECWGEQNSKVFTEGVERMGAILKEVEKDLGLGNNMTVPVRYNHLLVYLGSPPVDKTAGRQQQAIPKETMEADQARAPTGRLCQGDLHDKPPAGTPCDPASCWHSEIFKAIGGNDELFPNPGPCEQPSWGISEKIPRFRIMSLQRVAQCKPTTSEDPIRHHRQIRRRI
jgi:hypothetical protein